MNEKNFSEEITVDATLENLRTVQDFIEDQLARVQCPKKSVLQVSVAVEEIYVNIAHYAYRSEIGKATVRCLVESEPLQITIQFLDRGTPFDPLKKADADTTLSIEERPIGGLGILMVKKMMDDVAYSYEGGKNILTIHKQIAE